MNELKALSVKQPWVWAMYRLPADVAKRVENRTWCPKWGIKPGQRFAIHASKGMDTLTAKMACQRLSGVLIPNNLPLQAIVGTAVYLGWVSDFTASSPELGRFREDRWYMGDYGWVIDDLKELPTPIMCPGALSLWNVPSDIVAKIRAAGCL